MERQKPISRLLNKGLAGDAFKTIRASEGVSFLLVLPAANSFQGYPLSYPALIKKEAHRRANPHGDRSAS
jgi:hypothetical protein